MAITLFTEFAKNVQVLDIPSPWCESPAVFPVIFILSLLRNFPASARQNVLLLKQEDISCMEECQIPVWARYKMFGHQQRVFSIPRSVIFQRRASFWVVLVTVYSTWLYHHRILSSMHHDSYHPCILEKGYCPNALFSSFQYITHILHLQETWLLRLIL